MANNEGKVMSLEEKVKWLAKLFSSSPEVRRQALDEDVSQPVFETNEELLEALDKLILIRS